MAYAEIGHVEGHIVADAGYKYRGRTYGIALLETLVVEIERFDEGGYIAKP